MCADSAHIFPNVRNSASKRDMPFFLDRQETYQRFGSDVEEFCSLLDADHVRHGSPSDLFEFAKSLESSNQLRLDLSALVKSTMKKEGNELLLTDMMSIIAASVGGPSFAETNIDITNPSNILLEFLLGTGLWRHFGSPLPRTFPSRVVASQPSIRAEERRAICATPILSTASSASENTDDGASLLDLSNELRQTLSKLESETMQVRRHLDSIERKIGRIESPNILPEQTLVSTSSFQHRVIGNVVQQSTAEDIPVFEPELPTRGRAVFSRQLQSDESRTDESFSSPTFSYVTQKKRSIIPVEVFLILLVIAGAGFFFVHSSQGHRLLNTGLSYLKDVRVLFRTAPIPIPPPPPAPDVTSDAHASTASKIPIKNEVEPPTVQSTQLGDTSRHIELAVPAATDNPRITEISAHLMAGHLLSAPRPEYPPLAKINHIEGQVTLQATISKTGTVEALHVIQGSPSLRSAAIDAVRNWRYTPYLANDHPIEVVTIVYVDFSLKPPPEIVH